MTRLRASLQVNCCNMTFWLTLSKSTRRSFIPNLKPLIYLVSVIISGSLVIKVKRLLFWRAVPSSKEPDSTAGKEKGPMTQSSSLPQLSPKVCVKTAEKKRKQESVDEDATCPDSKRAKNSGQGESTEGSHLLNGCPDKASSSWGQWACKGHRSSSVHLDPRLCPAPDINHGKGNPEETWLWKLV